MLIPLADENPTTRIPFVTVTLIAVNVLIFAWEATLPPTRLDFFLLGNAFIPAHFAAAPFSLAQWRTLLTSLFLHGGWLHVGFNMLYLWIFGNNIEDRLGPIRFLGLYLAAGIAATLLQFAVIPTEQVPLIGASGAVAGTLGAYLLLYPEVKVVTLIPILFFFTVERLSAALVIGFWFVLQLVSGVLSLGGANAASGGVAFFAHVGGFIAGMLLVVPAWRADRREARG